MDPVKTRGLWKRLFKKNKSIKKVGKVGNNSLNQAEEKAALGFSKLQRNQKVGFDIKNDDTTLPRQPKKHENVITFFDLCLLSIFLGLS